MPETLEENPPWQVSWGSPAPSCWPSQVYVLVHLAFLCGLSFELSPVLLAPLIKGGSDSPISIPCVF